MLSLRIDTKKVFTRYGRGRGEATVLVIKFSFNFNFPFRFGNCWAYHVRAVNICLPSLLGHYAMRNKSETLWCWCCGRVRMLRDGGHDCGLVENIHELKVFVWHLYLLWWGKYPPEIGFLMMMLERCWEIKFVNFHSLEISKMFSLPVEFLVNSTSASRMLEWVSSFCESKSSVPDNSFWRRKKSNEFVKKKLANTS